MGIEAYPPVNSSASSYATIDFARSLITGKNLLHNGAMNIYQRADIVQGKNTNGYYTADRWYMEVSGTPGTWDQSTLNDAPSESGFVKSLKMAVATGGQNTSLDASDYCIIQQRIEGQDLQHLKFGTSSAESLTASFWVKTNVTGTHVLNLWSADSGYHYTRNYTISSSNVWTKISLTFPGDTVRAFNNHSQRSLDFSFWLTAGSTWNSGTQPLTSWTNTTNNLAAGQVNISAAAGNYFQFTGVQLEIGTIANQFEFKTYAQQLMECQRYYQTSYSPGTSIGAINTEGAIVFDNVGGGTRLPVAFPTVCRVAPSSIVFYNPTTGASGSCRNVTASTNIATQPAIYSGVRGFTFDSGVISSGHIGTFHYVASADL